MKNSLYHSFVYLFISFYLSSNDYSNDILPPPPYQTFNITPNAKLPPTSNGSHIRKFSSNSRHNQTATSHRDLSIPVTELKSSRRLHRTKQNLDQQNPSIIYRVEGTKERFYLTAISAIVPVKGLENFIVSTSFLKKTLGNSYAQFSTNAGETLIISIENNLFDSLSELTC